MLVNSSQDIQSNHAHTNTLKNEKVGWIQHSMEPAEFQQPVTDLETFGTLRC